MHTPLSKVERLILRNQYAILEELESDYRNKEFLLALDNGYTKEIREFLDESVSDELPEEICHEVWDILDLFRALDSSYNQLDDLSKKEINTQNIQFKGFDANHDKHYGYMHYILKDRELYSESKASNSHSQSTLPSYRRMLAEWQKLGQKKLDLTKEEIQKIANAQYVTA